MTPTTTIETSIPQPRQDQHLIAQWDRDELTQEEFEIESHLHLILHALDFEAEMENQLHHA